VRDAILDIDHAIAQAQAIAKAGGWSEGLRIWVVADHGHAPVSQHEDLHGWLEARDLRVRAHPRLHTRNPDVVLMVGGNAMAHLYLDPASRTRSWWPSHAARWETLHDALLARDAVDLVAVGISPTRMRIAHHGRGVAEIATRTDRLGASRWDYDCIDGDPLLLGGSLRDLDDAAAWTAGAASPYPDALVQLSALAASTRAGDLIVSAADGWDLRSRFEPVAHVSTHGALLAEQMMVPLIIDGAVARQPQRTADVMPSVLDALGIEVPTGLDGRSFL
jgi:Type I phosphodiesterase / nucleotide pyrophosphatase